MFISKVSMIIATSVLPLLLFACVTGKTKREKDMDGVLLHVVEDLDCFDGPYEFKRIITPTKLLMGSSKNTKLFREEHNFIVIETYNITGSSVQ